MKECRKGFSLIEVLVTLALFHLVFFLSLAIDHEGFQAIQDLNRLIFAFSQQHAYQSGLSLVGAYSPSQEYWQKWDEHNQFKFPEVAIQMKTANLIFFWNGDQPDCDQAQFNSHCVAFLLR